MFQECIVCPGGDPEVVILDDGSACQGDNTLIGGGGGDGSKEEEEITCHLSPVFCDSRAQKLILVAGNQEVSFADWRNFEPHNNSYFELQVLVDVLVQFYFCLYPFLLYLF